MSNSNTLWNSMGSANNITTTENGDKAYKSTLNPLLDFMFKGGTMRNASENDIVQIFSRALTENPVYAIRLLFYTRDIRGGQGERRFFRICMQHLALTDSNTFMKVLHFIPEYGRWDDMIWLYQNVDDNKTREFIGDVIKNQLADDINIVSANTGKSISLLAKWMPSENASSKTTIHIAKKLRQQMDLSSKEYRQMLSSLRKYLDVVERKTSSNKWNEINYNGVPSKAMMKYKQAFYTHDMERYSKYIEDLTIPESGAKVNAAALYPFDIISKINPLYHSDSSISREERILYNSQWNSLPDFFAGKFDNALVVADVSGSMSGTPINVCLGLAIYLAERNKGMFNNKFITFSGSPSLQEIAGKDIVAKAVNLCRADWEGNTDIDAVFKLIYNSAIENNIPQEELPSMIYIISDMQFDECCANGNDTVFEKWQKTFAEAGYTLPTICFWNVSPYGDNVPITINNSGAILCSGYSPAVVKYIMESDTSDTFKLVENIVNNPRYSVILA